MKAEIRITRKYQELFKQRFVPVPESGCWLWTHDCSVDGYGRLKVYKKARRAHRVSWVIHKGPIPDGMYVCHKCDVRSCVNPDHLFLGTAKDNILDCKKKGRLKDQRGRGAKLTPEQVIRIRNNKISQGLLAKLYRVSESTIWAIRHRKNWNHLS